jgi:hypothetical protein
MPTKEEPKENEVQSPASLYERDKYGLIKSIEYIFNPDGSVNWRAMIPNEFLYPRKEWFERKGKEPPKDDNVEGLPDEALSIKLGGIKHVARLRGIQSVDTYFADNTDVNHCTAICSIDWIPNYENPNGATFTDVGSANAGNTDSFGMRYLETIAANRAFVRAVRNFLNIYIVALDEIGPQRANESVVDMDTTSPQYVLMTMFKNVSGGNWEEFKNVLRGWWKEDVYKNENAKGWSSFKDIPTTEARKLIGLVKQLNS